jgi:hypothetical protein
VLPDAVEGRARVGVAGETVVVAAEAGQGSGVELPGVGEEVVAGGERGDFVGEGREGLDLVAGFVEVRQGFLGRLTAGADDVAGLVEVRAPEGGFPFGDGVLRIGVSEGGEGDA